MEVIATRQSSRPYYAVKFPNNRPRNYSRFREFILSEFYSLRRKSIADSGALIGAILGLFAPAPMAWPSLAMRFARSDFTSGLMYFMAAVPTGSAVGGVICRGVCGRAGRLW